MAYLARIIAAWPTLPDPIRRAVLALVASATPAGPTDGRSVAKHAP